MIRRLILAAILACGSLAFAAKYDNTGKAIGGCQRKLVPVHRLPGQTEETQIPYEDHGTIGIDGYDFHSPGNFFDEDRPDDRIDEVDGSEYLP